MPDSFMERQVDSCIDVSNQEIGIFGRKKQNINPPSVKPNRRRWCGPLSKKKIIT